MATDTASRPVRTLVQAGVAGVVVEFSDAFIYDMDDRQYGALLGLLVVVFSWLQVVIENRAGGGLLRNYDSVQGSVVDKPTQGPGGNVA